MIPGVPASADGRWRKPRASGDDPGITDTYLLSIEVNPARAGMILGPGGLEHQPTA